MSHLVTVTGASGHIGKLLAEQLLNRGIKVRAVARKADRLAPLVAKGAGTCIGDLNDAAFVAEAFRNADAVFLMIPPDYSVPDARTAQHRIGSNLADALRKTGVPRAVVLSSLGGGLPSGTGLIAGLHDFEEMLRSIPGLSLLILRPAYFMENHLSQIPIIKNSGIAGSAMRGDVPLPMVATRDIAVVAAGILSAPLFKGQSVREILGPRDCTMRETTAILGAAIGKPSLDYVEFSYSDFRKGLLAAGFSESVADGFVEMVDAFNSRKIQPTFKRTPENTSPTTLEEFASEVFARAFRSA